MVGDALKRLLHFLDRAIVWFCRVVFWGLLIILLVVILDGIIGMIKSTIRTGDPLDYLFGPYKIELRNNYYLVEGFEHYDSYSLQNWHRNTVTDYYINEMYQKTDPITDIVDYKKSGKYYLLLTMDIGLCDTIHGGLDTVPTTISTYHVFNYLDRWVISFDSYQKYQVFLTNHNITEYPLKASERYLSRVESEEEVRQKCINFPDDWHWQKPELSTAQ